MTVRIVENIPVARGIFKMTVEGNPPFRPGQFAAFSVPGKYLRRPISICDWEDGRVEFIYRVSGSGTEIMSRMRPGEDADVLYPLGSGFDIEPARGKRIALFGGGVGAPPMVGLARKLKDAGLEAKAVLGFSDKDAVICADMLEGLGIPCEIFTVDGSMGRRGVVTDTALEYDYYFACGPKPMLRAVWKSGREGQLSLEERMGCGFGVCMGCSQKTASGYKRLCMDGPVLFSSEVMLDE